MFQILVVDDDKSIRKYYHSILTNAEYKVHMAASAKEAMSLMDASTINLLILDVTMPEIDGFTFARMLRECNNTIPILMISARQLPKDIKKGFLCGADDYMTKPVDEDEMLLRIKALLRRSGFVTEHTLLVGSSLLDYNHFSVTVSGHEEYLPQKEFCLLYKLLSSPEQIFTRTQLMDDIWGPESESTDATVSVHINRLRKRFYANKDFKITTVRGLGYKASLSCSPEASCTHPHGTFTVNVNTLTEVQRNLSDHRSCIHLSPSKNLPFSD